MNASDVPDHEPTTDISLPEKASAAAGDTVADTVQAGPEDATARVPLPIAAAAPWTAEFAVPGVPSPDEPTHQSPLPPFQPPGGFAHPGPPHPGPPPTRSRRLGRSWVTLVALVAAIAVVVAGALAALLWPGGGGKRPVAAVTSSAPAVPGAAVSPGTGPPSSGTPSPQVSASAGGTVPGTPPQTVPAAPGPVASTAPAQPGGVPPQGGGVPPNGLAMPYRTVQQDQGYFEATVTVTNRTSAPLFAWELSFSYPGAQVRTVWGGVLVQVGSQVVIRNDPATGSIPPGGTHTVKFGAGGAPSMPQSCRFGGRECGFTP